MISKVARSFEGYKEASKHWWLWACRGACTHVQAVIFDVLIDKLLKVEPALSTLRGCDPTNPMYPFLFGEFFY